MRILQQREEEAQREGWQCRAGQIAKYREVEVCEFFSSWEQGILKTHHQNQKKKKPLKHVYVYIYTHINICTW